MSDNHQPLTLAEVERQIIASAVQRMDARTAAKVLGISPGKLYRKLREYNIEPGHELPQFAQLMQAASDAAAFLEKCGGTMAPRLGKALRESMAPFLGMR